MPARVAGVEQVEADRPALSCPVSMTQGEQQHAEVTHDDRRREDEGDAAEPAPARPTTARRGSAGLPASRHHLHQGDDQQDARAEAEVQPGGGHRRCGVRARRPGRCVACCSRSAAPATNAATRAGTTTDWPVVPPRALTATTTPTNASAADSGRGRASPAPCPPGRGPAGRRAGRWPSDRRRRRSVKIATPGRAARRRSGRPRTPRRRSPPRQLPPAQPALAQGVRQRPHSASADAAAASSGADVSSTQPEPKLHSAASSGAWNRWLSSPLSRDCSDMTRTTGERRRGRGGERAREVPGCISGRSAGCR